MKKRTVSILAYDDVGDLASCLESLRENAPSCPAELFCLCEAPSPEIKAAFAALDERGVQPRELIESRGRDFMSAANELFLNDDEGYLLFLSSRIRPCEHLAGCLLAAFRHDLGGVNPMLLAGWTERPLLAFLGLVCDCRQFLHYLYEGIEPDDALAARTRTFQFAHPGALLIRKKDFRAVGGFNVSLDYLSFYDFCLRLEKISGEFLTTPQCRALLLDRFDSWKFCGIWNSAVQGGRLRAPDVKPNMARLVREDGLEARLDAWLNEYAEFTASPEQETSGAGTQGKSSPRKTPHEEASQKEEAEIEAWLAFRRHPEPASLLRHVATLPLSLRGFALELAVLLPATLPATTRYYEIEAEKIARAAKFQGFAALEADAKKWLKSKSRFMRGRLAPGVLSLQKNGVYNCSLTKSSAVFNAWIDIGEKFSAIEPGASWPRIAVIMPVYDPAPEFLREAMESVRAQSYPDWLLCIADDASTNPEIAEMLRDYMSRDPRIRVIFRRKNGHICEAGNSALTFADAPFSAFLDHDDALAPQALAIVAQTLAENPALRFVYSDEDHINAENVRSSPIFKPDFDPNLMFTGHLSVYETDLIRKACGFRKGFEGSQDFDLALRICEKLSPGAIAHLPHILYHWRIHDKSTASSLGAKPYVLEATKRAWLSHAQRMEREAEIAESGINNFYNLAYKLPRGVSCSAVFLSDAANPLPQPELIASLARSGAQMEFLVQPLERRAQTPHHSRAEIKFLPWRGDGEARAINAAAEEAGAQLVLFLYAGLVPAPSCRPEQLLFQALRKDVSACGGLLWKKGRLVDGGKYPDVSGVPFTLHAGLSRTRLKDAAWGQFLLTRRVLGLSWQCFCMRKNAIPDGEFLDERLGESAVAEFCIREIAKGNHVLASPFGQWENAREERPTPDELSFIREAYGDLIRNSGLRNANLRAAPDHGWTLIF